MLDLRMVAVFLLLLGLVLGLLPGLWLTCLTVALVAGATVFLRRANRGAPGGTSGAMGLTFMVVGALVALLIPAWLIYVIR